MTVTLRYIVDGRDTYEHVPSLQAAHERRAVLEARGIKVEVSRGLTQGEAERCAPGLRWVRVAVK